MACSNVFCGRSNSWRGRVLRGVSGLLRAMLLAADRLGGMPRSSVEAPATHFRLKPETWALIAEEYKNGATAKELGAKWKVSGTSIYRYACRDGWTKKAVSDVRARAHAQSVEDEQAAARSMDPVGSRATKALFADHPEEAEAADPAALARLATLASGRAMKGRLWNEAKALAGLAESYGRVSERSSGGGAGSAAGKGGGGGFTLEDMYRAMFDRDYRSEVMDMSRDAVSDPIKSAYWKRFRDDQKTQGDSLAEIMNQGFREGREAAMLAMGLEPRADEPDEYAWYHSTLCRRAVIESKRSAPQTEAVPLEEDDPLD